METTSDAKGGDAGAEDRLSAALERLASIQKSVRELNLEAQQIRRRIKDFDVNIDALNLLATVRSRYEKRGEEQVLEDVIRYARQTGMPLEPYGSEDPPQNLVASDSMPLNSVPPSAEAVEKSTGPGRQGKSSGLVKVISQLMAAAALTMGLFVLIH